MGTVNEGVAGSTAGEDFPRAQARTRRFTLGVPRSASFVAVDGVPQVLFLRSDTGEEPTQHLWAHDTATGRTRRLADAHALGEDAAAGLPDAERSRRERAREQAAGIVSFAVDRAGTVAAFALGGRLYAVDPRSGEPWEVPTPVPAFDPRPSPDGRLIAYHGGDALHLADPHDVGPSHGALVVEDGVAWGRAEFVAAEEMGRSRGFWWSPDSEHLAVARVDERSVGLWHLGDPATPWRAPTGHRYPAAGTANAEVSLAVVEVATGRRTPVGWPDGAGEYLARVEWSHEGLLVVVQSRDQRRARVMTVDPRTGVTTVRRELVGEPWLELVPGVPTLAGGRLLTVEDRPEHDDRALLVDGSPVTPAGLQVRELLAADGDGAWFLATVDDPTQVHVARVAVDGGELTWLTADRPGVHRAVVAGDGPSGGWAVVSSQTLEDDRPRVHVVPPAAVPDPRPASLEVVSLPPAVEPRPRLLTLGRRGLRAALLLPTRVGPDDRLPVVLDPYGGPHAQRVVRARHAFLTSQWLADRGFAVLVVDGRGSPGRGPSWEHAVHRDLATPVLEDQVDALRAALDVEPRLDVERVGIRGWSFGGYLAALAVLRRPDVFRAAVAGAPVTDWCLYDTHYTERYLSRPDEDPQAYAVSSLVDAQGGLLGAQPWDPRRPPRLLLVHGLADDNVVAAHTLRLSAALLAEGRPHEVLPLTGVTHMTPQETISARLLEIQADFLARSLTG